MKTNTKHCNKCDTTKTVDQFYKDKSKRDELQSYCKECKSEHGRNWRESNPTYSEDWYKANPDYNKKYQSENAERIATLHRDYERKRKAVDPLYRWVAQTRCRLRHILHGTGSHQPTLDLLGCNRQEYRDHLESQFTDGMSWDNYGEWQVDHIIPVSAFDQNKLDERAICWHYSNTQPLWAEDNMAKGSKLPTE
jgi:hypothetical protein